MVDTPTTTTFTARIRKYKGDTLYVSWAKGTPFPCPCEAMVLFPDFALRGRILDTGERNGPWLSPVDSSVQEITEKLEHHEYGDGDDVEVEVFVRYEPPCEEVKDG